MSALKERDLFLVHQWVVSVKKSSSDLRSILCRILGCTRNNRLQYLGVSDR